MPSSVTPSAFFSAHNGLHRHLRAYLLGVLDTRLGDYSAAERHATELERLGGTVQASALARDLAHSVRAQVASMQIRPAAALRELERARMETWYELPIASPFYSQAYERYLRAELLNALGRPEEALPWYGSFADFSIYDLVYLAPSHLRRGEIYERLGQREKAVEHYARFIELWKDCDPELRPLVDGTKDRLARLTSEGAAARP